MDYLLWLLLAAIIAYVAWRIDYEIGCALAEADRQCDPYHEVGARRPE